MNKKKICIISLLLSVVATAIGSGAMGIMMSHIIDDYALASAQEGLMSSCISFGALTALVVGILFRGRVYKTQFILWGGLLMAAMLVMKSVPVPFAVFLMICFVMGTGMGIMDSFQSSFLTDLNPENTARSLGFLHGIFGVGGVVLPLLLHRLLADFSWHTVYRMVGLLCVALMVQFGLMVHVFKKDIPVMKKLEKSQSFHQIGDFLKKPYFVLLLLCMFLAAMGQNGIITWVVRYVSVVLGDTELAPLCLSLFWVASTVSRVFVPYLPVRPTKFLGIGSVTAGIAWGMGIMSGSSPVMLVVCVIAGLTTGCGMPLLLSEGADFSRNNTGLTTSMLMIIKTIGQILMPIIVSAVQSLLGVTVAMILVAAVFAADGLIAVTLLRMKTRRGAFS